MAVMLTGCISPSSGAADVSAMMRQSLLPAIGMAAGLDQMLDWHDLNRPTAPLRKFFDSYQATYRVIEADTNAALLAVWRTGPPAGEPFNANRVATGTGCAALQRQSGTITSAVIDCPSPLAESQPSSTDISWGRDSEAMHQATVLIEGPVDQEVRWLMTKEADGSRRVAPRTMEDVVTAVGQAQLSDGENVVLSDVQQQGRLVTGVITARATGVDPVDTNLTVRAQACATMKVDLDEMNPNDLFTEAPCPDRSSLVGTPNAPGGGR